MAERVVIQYGKYEVDPARMTRHVTQQEMNEEERDRIIRERHEYLRWMHEHFADQVLPPPETA